MSTGSWTHYGFVEDTFGNIGITGALLTDLNMGGHDITNVDAIDASSIDTDTIIVNNDASVGGALSVTGCISGGSGLPANLCEGALLGDDINMQNNDITNIASMTMLQDQAANTTNYLTISTINASGPPTSVPTAEGAMIWTKTDDKLWIWNGSAWQNMNPAITWSNVLATGNTSGATDPTISHPQTLVFSSAVRVGSGGTGSISAAATNDVIIGTAAAFGGSANTVIGSGSVSGSGTNRVHLGSGGTSTIAASNPTFAVNGTINSSSGGNVAILGTAQQTGDIVIGQGASSSGNSAANRIAIGINAVSGAASNSNCVAIGTNSSSTATSSVALGASANGSNSNAVAIGSNATASGSAGIAIGNTAVGSNTNAIAIGTAATASGSGGIAIGNAAQGSTTGTVALGVSAKATVTNAIALGNTATAAGTAAIAIGQTANVSSTQSIGIGLAATPAGTNDIAIGSNAITPGTGGSGGRIAIGSSSTAGTGTVPFCVAIGPNASATGSASIAIGRLATTSASDSTIIGGSCSGSGQNDIVIGTSSTTSGTGHSKICIGASANAGTGNTTYGIAIGSQANASAAASIALGRFATVSHTNSTAIGISATTTANNQIMLGNNATGGTTQVYGSVGTAGEVYSEGFLRSRATVGASISPGGPQTLVSGVGATVIAMPTANYSLDYQSPTIASVADQLQLRQYRTISGFLNVAVQFAGAVVAGGYLTARVLKNTNGVISAVATQDYYVFAGSTSLSFNVPFMDYNPTAATSGIFIYADINNPAAFAQNMNILTATHLVGCYNN